MKETLTQVVAICTMANVALCFVLPLEGVRYCGAAGWAVALCWMIVALCWMIAYVTKPSR